MSDIKLIQRLNFLDKKIKILSEGRESIGKVYYFS
jgi:hypothetical protein